jgi:hypothetical protein
MGTKTQPSKDSYAGLLTGYINHKGEFVIPPQFDFANEFSEGLAVVTYHGKAGVIVKAEDASP